jgi:F0F1-type ATP synthase beta subunit
VGESNLREEVLLAETVIDALGEHHDHDVRFEMVQIIHRFRCADCDVTADSGMVDSEGGVQGTLQAELDIRASSGP